MERLRNPILFLVLLLLPFLLYFTGWRYWWMLQISLQLVVCFIGVFLSGWRLVALAGLILILASNFTWFSFNPDIPKSCQQQVDHFSGVVESDRDNQADYLRLIKIEFWCKGEVRRWPSAELKAAGSSFRKTGWFRKGNRIGLKNITINKRNLFTLDIEPTSRVRIVNFTYLKKALSRSPLLLYIQKKARYFLNPFPNSVYKSLITADRSSLTDDWKKRINELGITHLFAISGMHIGILYLWFSLVMRWLISFPSSWIERGVGVLVTDAISIVTIFVFLKGIGMPISAERSFIMLAWWGLMRHFLGWQPLWFILCGTAVIILVDSPIALGQKSFQLSFLSVAGIIQILPFLPRRRLQDSILRVLLKLFVSSLIISAWLFVLTMPLVSQLAESFSLMTPLNNVIHIYYLSFVFLPFSLLVMFITVLGFPWSGTPIDFYLYSLLNVLGKLWEKMLIVNDSWSRFFLFEHNQSWHLILVLIWVTLFMCPFLINGVVQKRRKR